MGPIENKVQHPQALVDSAPGHQETKNALLYAGHFLLSLRYPHLEPSFKRTNQLDIPASVKRRFKRRSSESDTRNVVLNDKIN